MMDCQINYHSEWVQLNALDNSENQYRLHKSELSHPRGKCAGVFNDCSQETLIPWCSQANMYTGRGLAEIPGS